MSEDRQSPHIREKGFLTQHTHTIMRLYKFLRSNKTSAVERITSCLMHQTLSGCKHCYYRPRNSIIDSTSSIADSPINKKRMQINQTDSEAQAMQSFGSKGQSSHHWTQVLTMAYDTMVLQWLHKENQPSIQSA